MNVPDPSSETPMLLNHGDRPPLPRPATTEEAARAFERHIERAAFGRINDLRVDHLGDVVVLYGRCRTYHAKQLAHQAALDLADDSVSLDDRIVVN